MAEGIKMNYTFWHNSVSYLYLFTLMISRSIIIIIMIILDLGPVNFSLVFQSEIASELYGFIHLYYPEMCLLIAQISQSLNMPNWPWRESNPRPLDPETDALPSELLRLIKLLKYIFFYIQKSLTN